MRLGDDRLTLSVSEVASLLGVSRGTVYESVRTGQLPSLTLGRRILIPRQALEALISHDEVA